MFCPLTKTITFLDKHLFCGITTVLKKEREKEETMMFLVKMMTNRKEGYNVVAKATTEDEAREYVRTLRLYYSPIDVYYTARPNTQAK